MDHESRIKESVLNILGRYKNEFRGVSSGLAVIYKNEWWRVVEIPGLRTRYYNTFWEFVEADSPFGCEANKEIIEAILKKVDDEIALKMLFPEKYLAGVNERKIGSLT